MSGLLPAAVYGLEVPNGDVMIPAEVEFPAAFRITMAAIDPSAEPEFSGTAIDGATPRATLKLIRQPLDPDEEGSEGDSEDEDNLQALLNGDLSDDEESSEDEEVNGGPSDPSKSKKARTAAALDALKKAMTDGTDDDDEMSVDGANGASKKGKGKAVATGDGDDSSDDGSDAIDLEEFVICTLDPSQHYQQPLDITIGEDEKVFFKVSGTHTIYLTGNYVIPVDDGPRSNGDMYGPDMLGEDEDYDLSPNEDELDSDEESDDLDDLDDPRITELMSDEEEEAPKLVKKSKNKRPAPESDDEPAGLDDIMEKSLKPAEPATKLSKKQQKKLKNNAGEAVKTEAKVETESPSGKKVQFAKNLEQGPTGTKVETTTKVNGEKPSSKTSDKAKSTDKPKSSLGVKQVKGVTVDDKKLGAGRAAKKGDKISMRYIGKLKDGKQFDANKKGKPFSFKLGSGEVISGWDIGVEGITVGGERRIIIPAHLGYGKKQLPGIPSNSELTFDIKCLAID